MSEEIFSSRLTRFREDRKLTKEQMASALGVTARYVAMMESGDKDVEPNSSLYKLFCLMESDHVSVRFDPDAPRSSGHRLAEEPATYKVTQRQSTQLTGEDVIDQIRADLELISKGPPAARRRTLLFLRDHHLPLLAKAFDVHL